MPKVKKPSQPRAPRGPRTPPVIPPIADDVPFINGRGIYHDALVEMKEGQSRGPVPTGAVNGWRLAARKLGIRISAVAEGDGFRIHHRGYVPRPVAEPVTETASTAAEVREPEGE